MKTNKLVIILTVMMLLASCGGRKYKYFTRINPDGTIYKKIIATGDSVDVAKCEVFPFNVEDGWKITYDTEIEKKEDKTDTINLVIAERTFNNLEEMQKCFSHQFVDSVENDHVLFENPVKFRWFYNYHTYRVTYQRLFPLNYYPVENYLTLPEQKIYWGGDDEQFMLPDSLKPEEKLKKYADKLDDKFDLYIEENSLAEYFRLLDGYTDSLNLPRVSDATKNKVYELNKLSDKGIVDDSLNYIVDSLEERAIASVANNDSVFAPLEDMYKNGDWVSASEDEYNYKVEVPGLLYQTNGTLMDDHTVRWYFTREWRTYKDIVMEVHYRTTNRWAFILSGILSVLILFILFYKKKNENRI